MKEVVEAGDITWTTSMMMSFKNLSRHFRSINTLINTPKLIGKSQFYAMTSQAKQQFPVKAWIDQATLKEGLKKGPELIGAIDNGTSSTRFILFTSQGRVAASAQVEYTQFFPSGGGKSGWHEHDPIEIWESVKTCMDAVLSQRGINLKERPVAAIGITNQRETTIAWNSETGKPYCNAIVWDDLRTSKIVNEIANGNADRLRKYCGLPLSPYFAGTKVRWMLDNVTELREDLQDPRRRHQVCFGTVDSWLLYQLTGKVSSTPGAANVQGMFATDVTNASRWLFMNLKTTNWDKKLVDTICAPHEVPVSAFPEILPSSHLYGYCSKDCGISSLKDELIPLTSILGDQQAALFGQCAFTAGLAKCTYGTGLFLMKNTGTKRVKSTHGLLTTVAYQLGDTGKVHYALEGSVSHSGSTIQWLRDKLNIIESAAESESLARGTESNEGLYFVPAFAGLFAPHWRSDARACIVGMTASHHKGHICRAALEAACYQAREVFEAIVADSPFDLKSLSVDGGATENRLMMQFQSDILNKQVIRPEVGETTALGAAFAAGLAVGVWKDLDELSRMRAIRDTFKPSMPEHLREKNWHGWKKAVDKSMNWVDGPTASTGALGIISEIGPLFLSAVLALILGFLLGQHRPK